MPKLLQKVKIKFAAIVVFDEPTRTWNVIGVIVQGADGEIQIRVAHHDALVRESPYLVSLEPVYNRVFRQEAEVAFYSTDPETGNQIIVRLPTTAPDFLEQYDRALAEEGKHIRMWNIRERKFRAGADLGAVADDLLNKVRTESLRKGHHVIPRYYYAGAVAGVRSRF